MIPSSPTTTNDEPRTEADESLIPAAWQFVWDGGWNAALTEVEEAVAGLTIRDSWEGDEAVGKVHDHIDGDCGFRSAVLAAITGLRR